MPLHTRSRSHRFVPMSIGVVLAAAILCCAGAVSAQVSQMYSFESPDDLDGFDVNSDFPGLLSTISLNTDTDFVSDGVQSLKWELTDQAYFEGALTANVDTGILNDPPGVDFIRFDLINTNRFVPDMPEAGVDPTFADMSVNVYGDFPSNPGVIENIQFLSSYVGVGDMEPGTHQIDIDVTEGGLLVGTGTIQGFDDWIADGLTVNGFQIYINKSSSIGAAFAWTVYLDNIRAGILSVGNGGDYNGNGTVDAADYAVWRDNLAGGVGPDGDGTTTGDLLGVPDGVVDEWDYDYWRQEFGNAVPGSGGGAGLGVAAVPEPGSGLLLIVAGAWLLATKRIRGVTVC